MRTFGISAPILLSIYVCTYAAATDETLLTNQEPVVGAISWLAEAIRETQMSSLCKLDPSVPHHYLKRFRNEARELNKVSSSIVFD
jgi:hypothetical protein